MREFSNFVAAEIYGVIGSVRDAVPVSEERREGEKGKEGCEVR